MTSAPFETFELRHPRGSSRIVAGPGALDAELSALAERLTGRATFLVTSEQLARRLSEPYERIRDRLRAESLFVPDGEAAKSVAVAEGLWRQLSRARADRDSVLVAFGGGSVGDLAGFVAATFARGLELVQLPTTLLAQVDAAIGGKCALDLPEAKNAVGVFHHPSWVVADSRLLGSLPEAGRRQGLVEAIKMAALLDLELLARIERDLPLLLAGAPAALGPVVAAAMRAKARVVERDPEERTGARMLLNFGHTLGHALEAEAGYGTLGHGDAVGYGLLFALRLSVARGGDARFADRVAELLERVGLPPLPGYDARALVERLGRDKKSSRGRLRWVLAHGAGEGRIDEEPAPDLVSRLLAEFLARPGGRPSEVGAGSL